MGFPEPQSGWQRVCPGSRLVLALLGFMGLISLLTVVFGITGRMAGKDLKKMEEALQQANRSISTEMLGLKQKGTQISNRALPPPPPPAPDLPPRKAPSSLVTREALQLCEPPAQRKLIRARALPPFLEQGIGSSTAVKYGDPLKLIAETDDLKKLATFNQAVEHLTDEMGKVKSEVQGKVAALRSTLNTMNCNMEDIKHNRTVSRAPCCPAGWDSFARHCYWVSRAEKPWLEAKADCEDKDAHLVTITSYLEQQFVAKRTKPRYAWIGLSFSSNGWKWVDGTSYSIRRIDWKTGHPYHFFQGVTDVICVHLHRDGLWNEDPCMHRYSWVCEMELKG